MEYKIKIEAFQGPMDLLLHLIDKAEIDIYDIPINIIAEQFIEYIRAMEELNLEIASEFLLMAATLLEIKSKMLLPQEADDSEEETEEEDPRAELIRRIVEYKKYKEAAEDFKELESIYSKMFFKPREESNDYVDDEVVLTGLNIDKLLKSLNTIIINNKKKIDYLDINVIQREEYTLEDCILDIKEKLERKEKLKFTELLDDNSGKAEIVVYFITLLELVKMKYINLDQDDEFTDLLITKL